MNAKVFINYRREDTGHAAGRLYDRLTPHFGQDQIFIDIDQIEPGEDFVEAIKQKVGSCDVAIVVIGPNWLHATDESGKRRLHDEEDFVRMEIVAALQRNIRVIPVLVDGARMPRKQDLPEALAPLSRRNAIELSETRFHADVNRLIDAIEKSFAEAEKKAEEEAARLAEEERQVAQLAALKLGEEQKAAEAEAARLADEKRKREEAARAAAEKRKAAEAAERAQLKNEKRKQRDRPYSESDRSQQDSVATAKDSTMPVKSTKSERGYDAAISWRYNQTTPAIPPVKEPAIWSRKRLIIVSAVGIIVALLLTITALLMRPHPSATPSPENDYAEARMLATGLGGTKIDQRKAVEYMQRAAAKNLPEAEASLAYWLNEGVLGLAKDNVKAAQWAKKAFADGLTAKATNGAAAQNALATLYLIGLEVSKDFGKAAELYQKAADQGYAPAQFHLGMSYYSGSGVPKDFGKAAELYQKAADQGYAPAQFNLGVQYENGEGVPKDLEKATELYQKAADQGFEQAISRLKGPLSGTKN